MSRSKRTEALKSLAAVLGVAGASAMPAFAAGGPQLEPRFATGHIADWAQVVERHERRLEAAGPFVPVVGKPDYGTAENAFGAARSGHAHEGQDMFAAPGTPLVAVTESIVAETGSDAGQGNYAYLYDPERDQTYVYMHMIAPAGVSQGDRVHAGEPIGGIGCTGSCWGNHLHFEIRAGRGIDGRPRDPMPSLRDWSPLERPR